MTEILNNPGMRHKFKVELAVTVDAMAAFVKATYNLERDGPLALMAYECVRSLYANITTPNVSAVAKHPANGDRAHEQQLTDYAKVGVEPAYAYFRSKFDNDLKAAMEAFKAARYFSQLNMAELQPTAADLDALFSLPFLKSNNISTLKSERSTYSMGPKKIRVFVPFLPFHSIRLAWAQANHCMLAVYTLIHVYVYTIQLARL